MSGVLHLIIPFARPDAPACLEAVSGLQLPRLQRLLALLAPAADPAPGARRDSLSMPHELALAGALGLPADDGRIPWAALDQARAGHDPGTDAWAWITPCHWRVGADHVAMDDPSGLELSEDESRELLALVAPYAQEDGLSLAYESPLRWLARGDLLADLPTASLDRVTGRRLAPWMPAGTPAARTVRRLQQEMQMLLYTHPHTDRRQQAGQWPVNSFWVSGAGRLPGTGVPGAGMSGLGRPVWPEGLRLEDGLRDAARRDDAAAWVRAWQTLDAGPVQAALLALEAGHAVQLTLCGDSGARAWSGTRAGWWQRATAGLRTQALASSLEAL